MIVSRSRRLHATWMRHGLTVAMLEILAWLTLALYVAIVVTLIRASPCAIVGPHHPFRPEGSDDSLHQMTACIARRDFITLLGGAAVWPLAVSAQQGERMRRVGVLVAATSDDPEYQTRIPAFQQGLAALGWTDGRNVQVDIRWATTNADEIRRHAVELTALGPDAIVAGSGTTTVAPLLQATRTVSIVFVVVVDPVGAGFVTSLRTRAAMPPASRRSNTA
jgi:ABC transporter substrate binding protein